MKNKYLLFLTLVFILSTAARSGAEVVDKISVVVNDEIITEGEIDRLLLPVAQKYRNTYRGNELLKKLEEARQRVVEQLIEDKLILGEAKKLNIEASDKEVEEKVSEAMSHFDSRKEFDEALIQQHIALKDLKQRYYEQLMLKKAVDKNISAKVAMTPVDVSNYYNSHIGEFSVPAEVKLWNILIKPDPIDAKKKYELVREILRRLREGGDFAALAKIYSEGPNASDGGLLGYVKKGDLLPEIEKVVFNMNPGETSNIIQTSLGYHIFKVEDKKDAHTLSFAEARRQAEEAVFRAKMNEKVKGWVEGLKKNAYIAFK